MQDFILKATASTYAHPKPAGRVAEPAGSSRVQNRSGNSFNGKRVSNHQSRTPTNENVGKCTEDAFWEKKPLQGRHVTPDSVLAAYENDRTSLRSGFFLEKLCLQNMLLNKRRVTPDQVIQEFNREPGRNDKHKLAIARFKAECCLKGLVLRGKQVTPEAVVRDYQAIKATRELARFKAECCLKCLTLSGQQVTPEAVVRDYQAAGATLELARFKEQCCQKKLLLNGQQVTPEAVVRHYQAAGATLELARFTADCCLKGLLLKGQLVKPEAVIRDYQAANATLELTRFKTECCLRGLPLNGQQITPDSFVRDFPDSPKGKLGMAHLKERCCLRGMLLKGQRVTPDMVVKAFPDSPEGKLGVARFKEQCCLKGLTLNGQQVTPDDVVKGFLDSPQGKLDIMRFKEQCCLKGLALNGQPVTPEAVVRDFQAARATLALARFKERCCLRGLLLSDRWVTPEAVVRDFQTARAILELARFRQHCALKGLLLQGQKVSPEAVIKDFKAAKATLELARFKSECCQRGLLLQGQLVSPEAVVRDYQAARVTLELARFKVTCCLKGLPLNGQPVTPDVVVQGFPDSPKGQLGIARFKEQCCLRGLRLRGQLVTPDEVVKDYERGGWWLERAVFYAQLALNARELNSTWLDHQKVLAAFNQVPGDHSARQTRYLIQQLKPSRGYEETSEAQDVLQWAWQILNKVSVRDDEQERLQCILQFMAMQHGLTIDRQGVSAEQVLQSIKTLRHSFQNSRIHFFFLAHCYITSQSIDGQAIHKDQVLECLQRFPEGSRLRHALGFWFEQCSCKVDTEARIIDSLRFTRANAVASGSDRPHAAPDSHHEALVAAGSECSLTKSGLPGFPEKQASRLHELTLKTLEIIQEINDSYTDPAILVTGSYARFLQNLCPSFNDIDIICTKDDAARTLFEKLQTLNSDIDAEIPMSIVIWPIPGCPLIKLPTTYNMQLKDGDLGVKAMGFQVIVDTTVTHGNTARLAVHVPGVNRPVWCLSFAGETGLLNDTLEYLADHLDPLTRQLQKGEVFPIPRTILFNFPQNLDEHIYGLLMRSLLTLNKARQFIALYSESIPETPECQTSQFQEHRPQKHCPQKHCPQKQRLQSLTRNLQMKLNSHVYRHDFEHRVNNWLLTTPHVNDYEISKKDFITALLALMHPEYQAFQ